LTDDTKDFIRTFRPWSRFGSDGSGEKVLAMDGGSGTPSFCAI
jgi:hypothetical protein